MSTDHNETNLRSSARDHAYSNFRCPDNINSFDTCTQFIVDNCTNYDGQAIIHCVKCKYILCLICLSVRHPLFVIFLNYFNASIPV